MFEITYQSKSPEKVKKQADLWKSTFHAEAQLTNS